ncbi:MAG: hypothetical protein KC486_01595, partial [Myxococcales bacterium]|nr:hypothetical protein [Myxococcales bacterium]
LSPELDAVESLASEAQRALMAARERLLLELSERYAAALAAGDYAPPGLRLVLAAQLFARAPRVVAGDEPETPALRRLAALPVLQVGSGFISLEAARSERPLGLRSLGLWRDAPLDVEVVVVDDLGEELEEPAEVVAEETAAQPAVISPEADLLAAIDGELRRIWAGAPELFHDEHLDWIRVGPTAEGALVEHRDGALWVNPRHPIVASLLTASTLAAVPLGVVVSAVYSALNHGEEAIVDAHEIEFHRLHAASLVASLCAEGPVRGDEARGPDR